MNKFYYTYMVYLTNPESLLYGCVYYGKHVTTNLLDGYIGSGKLLRRYLNKYPNDYYRKVLHLYNSEEELNIAEYELIKPHLGKPYCLNLMYGGHGGKQLMTSKETRKKLSESHKGKRHANETKQKMSESHIGINTWTKGKKRLEKTKKKISESLKGKQLSNETKQKISESLKGINTWTKGRIPQNKGKHRVYHNDGSYHYE